MKPRGRATAPLPPGTGQGDAGQGDAGAFDAGAFDAGELDALLARVRRRLRVTWLVAVVQWLAPAVAVGALVLVLTGFARPWSWPEPAALVLAPAVLVAIAVAALAVRVPPLVAARAADRGLASKDAFATALELRAGGHPAGDGPFAEPVSRRARALAAGRRGRETVALRWQPRRIAVALVAGALAVGAGLAPNHQDGVRARRAADRRAVAAQVEELRKTAGQLGDQPAARETADALRALAESLEHTTSLTAARQAIDTSLDTLSRSVDPNLLGQKAAALGLERSTQAKPVAAPPAGQSPASQSASAQLAAAAAAAPSMSEADRTALAERLEQLAAAQQGANDQLAAQLGEAAAALRAGNGTGAQAALSAAAGSQAARIDSIARQQAAAAGAQAAGNARRALDNARRAAQGQAARQGQGEPGRGNGQGQGQGAGQGQGQGQGAGQGQGQGQGQGGGSGGAGGASGQVAGSQARTGNGQGGPGSLGGKAGGPKGTDPVRDGASIFDPAFTPGDEVLADPLAGDGPGEVQGRTSGANVAGGAQTPLAQALPRYAQQATQALDTLAIPPAQRDLVKAYFDQLAERQK